MSSDNCADCRIRDNRIKSQRDQLSIYEQRYIEQKTRIAELESKVEPPVDARIEQLERQVRDQRREMDRMMFQLRYFRKLCNEPEAAGYATDCQDSSDTANEARH